MLQILSGRFNTIQPAPLSAREQQKYLRRNWFMWFLAMLALTALTAYFLTQAPLSGTVFAWLLYAAGVVVILRQPRYGLYLIVFLTFIGDRVLTIWYPFLTNFSSHENPMFIHDSVIVNPFETYLVLTFLSWFVRAAVTRKLRFFWGELFWPAILFLGFILFSFVYGVTRNGNLNVALWEIRPIVYLPVMLVLTSNMITDRRHVNVLMWLIMISIFLKGITGTIYVATELQWDIHRVESITEHSAAVHFNSLFLYTLGAWIFKDSIKKRILLPLMSVPVLISFLSTQRRASYLVLLLAMLMVAVVLFHEKRKLFWRVIPAALIIFVVYAAVFWNSQGAIAMPIRALKSQIAPQQTSARDKASDVYRINENFNIISTIRRAPITGIGFGHMFDMVVLLPDISFFVWYRYVTHNSILWIWMNAGIGGFLSMLLMIGVSLMSGLRTFSRLTDGYLKVAAFSALFYILMHFIFAYADIAWDNQSMIYVGTMMGLLNCLEHVAAQPVALPAKRWPWQPDPTLAPALQPISGDTPWEKLP